MEAAEPRDPRAVLLAGVSVRMLAQSCARAGIAAIALDWFADTDTASSSHRCAAVARSDGTGFDRERLIQQAELLAPPGSGMSLIYGGGFDGRPELLEALMPGRTLYGNRPDTLRRVKTPEHFFGLLDQLGIPYPPTRLRGTPDVSDADRWLIKQRTSEGGTGIARFGPGRVVPGDSYLQLGLDEPAHSLLFLADGKASAPVGFNRLLTAGHDPDRPLLFGGALTPTTLNARQRRAICHAAGDLTRTLGLVGLNSLDFVVSDARCHVLEINPRPSATLCLHDRRYPLGLLAAHLAACRGVLTPASLPEGLPRGFRIVYAQRDGTVPGGFSWPAWTADRPTSGTKIAAGSPLCTVSGDAESLPELERVLFARERLIRTTLML